MIITRTNKGYIARSSNWEYSGLTRLECLKVGFLITQNKG